MTPRSARDPLVPVRVDRLRAAQRLDSRSWPEIAKELDTEHQRLYHLTTADGPAHRRCRKKLRDGFAKLFNVSPEWLSGETDALRYVLSADVTVVALPFPEKREVHTRLSMFKGAGPAAPGLQLALDRLLAKADGTLARDESQFAFDERAKSPGGFSRPYALFLIAASVEVGLDLVRPLPPIGEAEALRISAVRHAEEVYRPWFEDRGSYPNWERIHKTILEQTSEAERAGVLGVLEDLGSQELFDAYEQLRRWGQDNA